MAQRSGLLWNNLQTRNVKNTAVYNEAMITVIIAGGSGTRLWPLSTSRNPKQLLSLIDDRSMIQNTYKRSKAFARDVYIAPETSLVEELRRQLPELDDDHIVVEPGRRGTANCIVAALAHVAKRHDWNEPVAIYWADHHIRDIKGFARAFKIAAEASRATGVVSLIGIEPTYASTVLGYIEKGEELDSLSGVYEVRQFKEKPDFELANEFFKSGNYLWNCGYMVASIATYLDQFAKSAPVLRERFDALSAIDDEHSQAYADLYLSYESEAIDYAFTEKVDQLVVVPATFDWMDVGNFKDLYDSVELDKDGNYQRGDNIHTTDVEHCYIRNEEPEKPVAVIGLDNVTVVNTPDGILVARTDVAARVGDIAKKVQA